MTDIASCRGCGTLLDLSTPGCRTCSRRHSCRRRKQRSGTERKPRGWVVIPAAPIREVLLAYQHKHDLSLAELACVLYGPAAGGKGGARRLYDILGGQAWITFDLADRFLCALGRPDMWYRDPVLAECYRSVKLDTRRGS